MALAYLRQGEHVEPHLEETLKQSIIARGFDDYVQFSFQKINHYFGRLSIRELASGQQPFSVRENLFTTSINGELYNQDELENFLMVRGHDRSGLPKGDMQLLGYAIAAFGPSILNIARGMYAGYIVDNTTRKVFCFRDRVGEKPLYILNSPEILIVSSTPVFTQLSEFDGSQLQKALLLGMFENESFLGGWKEVPPGSYASIDLEICSQIEYYEYWNWPKYTEKSKTIFKKKEIENLIRNSVRRQLVSDVPFCTLMSGGIDSALITKFAQDELGKPIDSFTLDFCDNEYSEIKLSQEIASSIGNNLHIVSISPIQFSSLVDSCLQAMPFPIFDTACLSLFALTKSLPTEFKVALTGDGGDELFGGYELLKYENLLATFRRLPRFARMLLSDLLTRQIASSKGYLNLNTRFSRASDVVLYRELSIAQIALSPIAGTPLFPQLMQEELDGINLSEYSALDYYRNQVLPCVYLEKSDRMGLANGVEIRAPLLDTVLIENVLSEQNSRKFSKKRTLKNLASEFIPPSVFKAKKHGFSAPICTILEHYPQPKWKLASIGISSSDAEIIWQGALAGRENFGIAAWALLVLQEFISRYEN